MTTRSLYRLYAREVHGKEAKGFVSIMSNWGGVSLTTLDTKGNQEHCDIDYQEMIYWIARKLKQNKVCL